MDTGLNYTVKEEDDSIVLSVVMAGISKEDIKVFTYHGIGMVEIKFLNDKRPIGINSDAINFDVFPTIKLDKELCKFNLKDGVLYCIFKKEKYEHFVE